MSDHAADIGTGQKILSQYVRIIKEEQYFAYP